MPLAMARPWKHPKTGIYWLRKGVPENLRGLLGKREEKRSLKTRDPVEAKRLHLEALTELEQRWANLRAGPVTLSEREAHEMARELHDRWIELHRDEPSSQKRWRTDLFDRMWQPPTSEALARPLHMTDWDGIQSSEMRTLAFQGVNALVQSRGLQVDEDGRRKLARAVAAVLQRASLALARQARGEDLVDEGAFGISTPPPTLNTPVASITRPAPAAAAGLSFDDAVKLWVAEKKPRPRTVYEWRRTLDELAGLVGHRDAHRLTVDDLLRWKSVLLDAERSTKTIRDAKIAPVRAILQVAVDNRRLAENVAEKVTVAVKKVAAEAPRDYTEKEAAFVLGAASKEKDPVLRWVPWLCAYSGARLSEICQLRREDITEMEGVPCMRFAAEAGPLKNVGSERVVPLHSALIETGFLAFAETVKAGPLFADLPPDTFGKRGGNGTKVIGRWVRGLGLTDPRLAPAHSWRHRFKTLGRRYDLRLDIVDALVGHAPKSVGNAYGAYPVDAMLREMEKIPTLKLDAT